GTGAVDPDTDVRSLGFDSLAALRVAQWLYTAHGATLRADIALGAGTPAAMAKLSAAGEPGEPVGRSDVVETTLPTEGQVALWLDNHANPERALGNIVVFGYRMTGDIDAKRLAAAV